MNAMKTYGMTIDATCNTVILFDVFSFKDCDFYFILANLVVFLISVGFEFCLSLRSETVEITIEKLESESTAELSEADSVQGVNLAKRLQMASYYFGIVTYSFLIMFILMSYNVWIIISTTLGNIVGYFIFGFRGKRIRIAEQTGCCST